MLSALTACFRVLLRRAASRSLDFRVAALALLRSLVGLLTGLGMLLVSSTLSSAFALFGALVLLCSLVGLLSSMEMLFVASAS